MAKVRVHNLAISLDGYAPGPSHGHDDPLGVGGERLHEWVFATRSGRGPAGGGTIRRTTTPCSCSRITHGRPSR